MRTGVHQLHQRLRVGIGERFKQHGVDHRKDGSIDADAHGDDQNRDGGEAGSLGERAEAKRRSRQQSSIQGTER